MLIAAYANSGVCKALRIMLDGEVLFSKGLVVQDFLNACINRSRFSRKASSTVKLPFFVIDAGSPGVKLQDVLMKTWRIRDLDLVA